MTEAAAKLDGKVRPPQQRGLREPWKPGQSGNPAGRPKGARNKLGEAFLSDLYKDWKQNGREVLEAARKSAPEHYFRTVAMLLPREVGVEVTAHVERIERVVIDSPKRAK